MSLEDLTGSSVYINALVATNPPGTDPKAQGDDHIRGVKNVLKNTFPNISGAVTASHTELNYVDGVTGAIQSQLDARQPLDDTLTALAGLSGTADKMIYFTGADAFALATLTGFARTLLDDADAATARTTLGLGTMATQNANAVAITGGTATLTGGTITGITDLAVADGGTGASDAATARSNLGLGSLAILSTVNNGNWSGTDLAVANGGTGASDLTNARQNLGVFFCRVDSAGTAVSLPSGWSSSRTATGRYSITHNLAKTNLVVIPCAETNLNLTSAYVITDANNVECKFANLSQILTNTAFGCIIVTV